MKIYFFRSRSQYPENMVVIIGIVINDDYRFRYFYI